MNKIAIVFDFDITLSPYYQQRKIIEHWGVNEDEFWNRCTNKVLKENYDMEHGYIKVLLEYIEENKLKLSNRDLYELGKDIKLYDGLSKRDGQRSIFDDIKNIVKAKEFQDLNISIEFYIISGGLTQMIKGALDGNNISQFFKYIFACTLDEDKNGIINFPKETVGHTVKTQKLFNIAKGLDKNVNEQLDKLEIPFENIIYLGDGETDIPSFSLVNQKGGISIAVYREIKDLKGNIDKKLTNEHYEKSYELVIKSQRARYLLPADYSESKELKVVLLKCVESLCKNIKIKKDS